MHMHACMHVRKHQYGVHTAAWPCCGGCFSAASSARSVAASARASAAAARSRHTTRCTARDRPSIGTCKGPKAP